MIGRRNTPSRIAVIGSALVAMILLTVVPVRAADEPVPGEHQVVYMASVDPAAVGCRVFYVVSTCQFAPDGHFYIRPVGTTFTFSIDDVGTQDGGAVSVYLSGDGVNFLGCIPVRTTRTFTKQSAGGYVYIIVRGAPLGLPCPGTAGVVTFTGVE